MGGSELNEVLGISRRFTFEARRRLKLGVAPNKWINLALGVMVLSGKNSDVGTFAMLNELEAGGKTAIEGFCTRNREIQKDIDVRILPIKV